MKIRYHWSFKLLSFMLAVLSGAVLAVGSTCLILNETERYKQVRENVLHTNAEWFCEEAADAVFDRFAWEGTGIEPKLFERFFRWGADVDALDSITQDFHYAIHSGYSIDGEFLAGDLYEQADIAWGYGDVYTVRRGYVTVMPMSEHYPTFLDFVDTDAVWLDLEGNPLPALGHGVHEYQYYVVSYDPDVNWQNVSSKSYDHASAMGADYTIYRIEYTHYDSYYVQVGLTAGQMVELMDENLGGEDPLATLLEDYREEYLLMVIWGGAGLLVSCLWLMLTAGKAPYSTEVRPGGLNRIHLDLYALATVIGAGMLMITAVDLAETVMLYSVWGNFEGEGYRGLYLYGAGLALCGSGIGLLAAMLLMAASAQFKMGNFYWLKHSAVGMCWKLGRKALGWCWRILKRGVGAVVRLSRRFVRWLPLTWQWLLTTGILWLVMLVSFIMAYDIWEVWPILLGALVTIPVVLYGAYCFGALRNAAKKMSGGDLTEKVDDKLLRGCFGDFAGHLNTLGDACMESARQQMKSERMKTELITNVSHDIKTPLTSIINYVDLLRRTEDEAEREEYLSILDTQSQRLKKLIEDLMEMSRASSGNVAVEITPTDVGEALHQALGEFADRLEQRGLTVVQKIPAEPVMARCDGRHLWRVLSNCLSNVVKYAMAGTRLYVDVAQRAGVVEISLKNISAQTLNISSEELMERFVRGDASRNTEGNGLGLNIAKSLMEVQGGRLDLVVDGDLFKVVLTLNAE